jgi:hypothetical protein
MSAHFFSRWSRRKQGLDQDAGPEIAPDPLQQSRVSPEAKAVPAKTMAPQARASSDAKPAMQDTSGHAGVHEQPPIPTLDDVQGLTPASDFQTFMRQGVPGEVRNAAMKKLFTDPHFNVMDGLDIYIGDYNTPDPLPPGMLEKMVGAELLNLFPKKAKDLPAEMAEPQAQENPEQSPDAPDGSPLVAQSPQSQTTHALQATPVLQPVDPLEHDHPDLQLQPNHAPASPDPGQSAG